MTDYWLSRSGVTLFRQIDRRWPGRDRRSDGWIGNADHAATASDHNPCWSCKGDRYGVVRAIDIDTSMGGKPSMGFTDDAVQLAEQLRRAMKMGDRRISYIIFNGKIASMSPDWQPVGEWRGYTGPSPHTEHIHVSFTRAGDHDGDGFECRILDVRRLNLTVAIRKIEDTISDLRAELRRKRRARRNL